jgi:hypothetical protein
VTGYVLVWTGKKFEDLGADYCDRLDRERLTNRLVKRLQRFGHKVSLYTRRIAREISNPIPPSVTLRISVPY